MTFVLPKTRIKEKKRGAIYCIEGMFVSVAEMAAYLKLTEPTVIARLKKLKSQPGAITWAKLGTK